MKKNLNKLATLALTGMMVAGMSFGAMADTGSASTNFYEQTDFLTKNVKTDGKTFAPNTTFNFKVEKVENLTGLTFKGKDSTGTGVNLGENYLKTTTDEQASKIHLSGVTFAAGSVEADLKENYTGTSTLTVDEDINFAEPGIYVFKVTEKNEGYEGVVYDGTNYYLLISVTNTSVTDSTLKVSTVGLAKADGSKVAEIDNYYGAGEQDHVYDLTLKKLLSGLAVNHAETFKFDVTVTQGSETAMTEDSREKYAYYKVDASEAETFGGVLEAGTESTGIELKENESIHIYGLSAGDKVTIKEETNTYTATYTATGMEANENTNNEALSSSGLTVHAAENGARVEVTNTKNEITVTGVAMNIAPYAAMVLGAGAFAGIFLGGKRRRAEDED